MYSIPVFAFLCVKYVVFIAKNYILQDVSHLYIITIELFWKVFYEHNMYIITCTCMYILLTCDNITATYLNLHTCTCIYNDITELHKHVHYQG